MLSYLLKLSYLRALGRGNNIKITIDRTGFSVYNIFWPEGGWKGGTNSALLLFSAFRFMLCVTVTHEKYRFTS